MKAIARTQILRRKPRTIQRLALNVQITGNLSSEQVEALAEEARERCFVENTLSKAIPVVTEVTLNGRRVSKRTNGPENAADDGSERP